MTKELNVFACLVELRGGIPEICGFCGEKFTEENYATPEECGEWACINCVNKWDNNQLHNSGIV